MEDVDTFEAKLEVANKTLDDKLADKVHAKDGKGTGRTRIAATVIIMLAIVAIAVFAWTTGVFGAFFDKGISPSDPVIGEWTSFMSTAHVDTKSVPAPGNTLKEMTFSASEDGSCILTTETAERKYEWSLVDKIDRGTLDLYLKYALKASGMQVGEFYIYMNSEADPWTLYLHFNDESYDIVFEKQ
ncbi:hypothetical protein [Adlercreutzia sp. ZJ141]|uniref:hypothetical protein n=1 Tax=Adlercreutzia sp. ZJ141 TaxID=2709406 RepID=UPI0013EB5C1B|nr:hypothetical protein [Adlercreutzia sp. ZJ141]